MVDRKHSALIGQSLVLGTSSGTTFSTSSEAANARQLNLDGSLSELATVAWPTGKQRPGLTMGYELAKLDPTSLILESTHGVGGTGLTALSKGGATGKYEEMVTTTNNGRAAALAAGDTFVTKALHLIQGERDQGLDDTPLDHYVALMQQMLVDFRADTSNPDTFFVTGQTATWAYYDKPFRIGGAQLKAARTLDDFYIVGGQYQLVYASDLLHMQSAGYYRLGELHARAERAVLDGLGWLPFAPKNYDVSPDGQTLVVTFDVPVAPLVFDTSIVAAQPDMGFSVDDTDAQITSVAITGSDEITLTLDAPLDEETYPALGYGVKYNNGGYGLGNLRDSDPRVSARAGTPLSNWSCQFYDRIFGVEPPPEPDPTPTTAFRYLGEGYVVGENGLLYPILDIV